MSEYTFLVLGDSKVGKTALIRKLQDEDVILIPYSETTSSTVYRIGPGATKVAASAALALLTVLVPAGQVKGLNGAVYVIDTPGSHALVEKWIKSLSRRIDCVVFAFAIDDRKSLANLWFWYRVCEDALGSSASQVKRLLIATKCDGGKAIGDDMWKHINSFMDGVCATFLSTSAYKELNVHKTFDVHQPSECSKIRAPKVWSLQSGMTSMPHTPLPFEVESVDFVITDIAFSPEGLTMKSNEILLKWGFPSQFKSEKMVLEVCDQKAPELLRNPSYSFIASKESEEASWVFQRTNCKTSMDVEARFQSQKLRSGHVKEISICTRDKNCTKYKDKSFDMMEVFENGQLRECTGSHQLMERISEYDIKLVDMSPSHAAAITTSGELLFRDSGDLFVSPLSLVSGVPCKVEQMSCGLEFTVILTTYKEVFAWGDNRYGQLGLGDLKTRPNFDRDCKIKRLTDNKKGTVIAIAAGFYHAAALKDTGRLSEWGLGVKRDKYVKKAYTPLPFISSGADRNSTVTSVCCGAFHTLCIGKYKALYYDSVFARGKGDQGQLGSGKVENDLAEAVFIDQLYKDKTVIQVAAGYQHSAFLTLSGEVFTCGNNEYGQLGYLTRTNKNPVVRKVDLGTDFRVARIMCRDDCTVAVGDQGDILMWGAASYHEAAQPLFPAVSLGVNQTELIDITTHTVGEGSDETELIVALTQRAQIVVCEMRDLGKAKELSLNTKDFVVSTNLKSPTRLCFASRVFVALDQTGRLFYFDPMHKSTVSTEQVQHHEFKGLAANCTFKHICATRNEAFFLSSLGDVYSWNVRRTRKEILKLSTTKFSNDLERSQQNPTKDTVMIPKETVATDDRNSEHTEMMQVTCQLSEGLERSSQGQDISEPSVKQWEFAQENTEKCRMSAKCSQKDEALQLEFVLHEHSELSHKVVTQIACGESHAVALTQDGLIYTFHTRSHGQLDDVPLDESKWFQRVILLDTNSQESITFKKISCGEKHTAAISYSGRVFIWDVSSDTSLQLNEKHTEAQLVDGTMQNEAPVGTPEPIAVPCSCKMTCNIRRLTDGTRVALDNTLYNVTVSLCSQEEQQTNKPKVLIGMLTADSEDDNFKVNLSRRRNDDKMYQGSFSFPVEGTYQLRAVIRGRDITDSPVTCQALQSLDVKTHKLMLLGPGSEMVKSVLNETNGRLQRGGINYEIWALVDGHDDIMSKESLLTDDFLNMLCITDGALYLYALCMSKFKVRHSLKRLKVWLHYLACKAPHSNIGIIGVNADEKKEGFCVNLSRLRKINANVKEAILLDNIITSESVYSVIDKCLSLSTERISKGFCDLENKVVECRPKTNFLSEEEYSQLASQCGLKQDYQLAEAAEYLEKVGVALFCGSRERFVVFDRSDGWFLDLVKEMKDKCPSGIADFHSNDSVSAEIKYILEILVKKDMAFKSPSYPGVYIPHLFPPLTGNVWLQAEELSSSSCVVVRNLIYNEDPLMLYATFPDFCAKISKIRKEVCFGEFSMVIRIPEEVNTEAKIECGPCLVDCTKTEIRVTVRSLRTEHPPCSLVSHAWTLTRQLRKLRPTSDVRVTCTECHQHYFRVDDAVVASIKGEEAIPLVCGYCRRHIPASGLLHGTCEHKSLPPLWRVTNDNDDKVQEGLLREILCQQKKQEKRSEELFLGIRDMMEEQLNEIQLMFSQMQKFINELQETETPTVVQVIPEYNAPLTCLKPIKWRSLKLFLMCEGNGDHTEMHMLETSCHKGYELPNETLLKAARYLRVMIKVFRTAATLIKIAVPFVGERLGGVLELVGIKLNLYLPDDQEKWQAILQKVDNHLAGMETKDRLDLALPENKPLQIAGADYRHLKEFLKKKEHKDYYGGLTKEVRHGGRVVWVCAKHRSAT